MRLVFRETKKRKGACYDTGDDRSCFFLACSAGVTYFVTLYLKKYEPAVQTFRAKGFVMRIENRYVEILLLTGKPRFLTNISNLRNFEKSLELLRRQSIQTEIQWEEITSYRREKEIRICWLYLKPDPRNPELLNICDPTE